MKDPAGWRLLHNTTTISLISNSNITLVISNTMLDLLRFLKASNSIEHPILNRNHLPVERHGQDRLWEIRGIERGRRIILSHRQGGVIG